MVCTTLHVFFFCLFSFVVCFVDETPSMCPESISAGEFYTFWSGFDYSRVMALLLIIWCLCPKEPFFWGISRPSFNLRGLSFHCFGPSHGNEAGVETKKLATEMEKISRKKMLEKCGCEFFVDKYQVCDDVLLGHSWSMLGWAESDYQQEEGNLKELSSRSTRLSGQCVWERLESEVMAAFLGLFYLSTWWSRQCSLVRGKVTFRDWVFNIGQL